MTITEIPNPLAGVIPAELTERLEVHEAAAGIWLKPLMDWCDKTIALRKEFEAATKAYPLGHIDEISTELYRVGGYDLVNTIHLVVAGEADRMGAFTTPDRDADVLELVERLSR